MSGIFITLEGGEGAGKSTQIPRIAQFLRLRGMDVVCLREPGGTPCAEQMRAILKEKRSDDKLCDTAELLLMYAARAQLTSTVILPALKAGKAVLCDRYDLSTLAYQGGGRGIALSKIRAVRDVAIGDFKPDLTLLFDIDVREGMARARGRGEADRFESSGLEFFEKVRKTYLALQKADPSHIKLIDASKGVDEVFAKAADAIMEAL
ncbi:MAG: dTMP kinase [Aeromonadales bacterium]|nr:dTMP kinase [Aeromonadales bacterium]MDY2890317.1 dTMP kinase [Succinivibrio sp.]